MILKSQTGQMTERQPWAGWEGGTPKKRRKTDEQRVHCQRMSVKDQRRSIFERPRLPWGHYKERNKGGHWQVRKEKTYWRVFGQQEFVAVARKQAAKPEEMLWGTSQVMEREEANRLAQFLRYSNKPVIIIAGWLMLIWSEINQENWF